MGRTTILLQQIVFQIFVFSFSPRFFFLKKNAYLLVQERRFQINPALSQKFEIKTVSATRLSF